MCNTPALQLKVLNNAIEQECACALGVLSGSVLDFSGCL